MNKNLIDNIKKGYSPIPTPCIIKVSNDGVTVEVLTFSGYIYEDQFRLDGIILSSTTERFIRGMKSSGWNATITSDIEITKLSDEETTYLLLSLETVIPF